MDTKVNELELIKASSNYLRGTLRESVDDTLTGALAPSDAQLSKFHGFYQQDDRDLRQDRQERRLEPYYSFMLRARLPGGVCAPEQWLVIDELCRHLGNRSIRLTTRQTFQLHGVLKHDLKPLIQGLDQAMIDSIGGCGDVNRNVLCSPNPEVSALHREAYGWARRISEHLLPSTRAYHEIWLDDERVAGDGEPLYGATYLPRKLKTAVAVPPHNDVDVYTNDLGFVAVAEDGHLLGFNVLAGGGMGATHGDTSTYPRLADELGFIVPADTLAVAASVVATQRDLGERLDRRHARLKYTIERIGLGAFRAEVERRARVRFQPHRPVAFDRRGDRYGWVEGDDGLGYLTLYLESGRVVDRPDAALLTGLREIAAVHRGELRITPNQNLVIAGIEPGRRARIEALARGHGLLPEGRSNLRLDSIACVALPTCPQAMAEAERAFPALIARVESLAAEHGVADTPIVLRVTGCPNGCARPYAAEIGLVGKAPGLYNLMLGGDALGTRLNRLYRESLDEDGIIEALTPLFASFARHRDPGERFGDFVVRTGVVAPVIDPAEDFHAHP